MKTFFTFVGVLLRVAVMVVLELFSALLTYMYLAVFNRDLFATLIQFSDWVLNASIKPTLALFPALEGQAYLTLIGELAPKAMLLLLIGLSVGALFRLLAWLLSAIIFKPASDGRQTPRIRPRS
jgi:hypothetical protein